MKNKFVKVFCLMVTCFIFSMLVSTYKSQTNTAALTYNPITTNVIIPLVEDPPCM